MKFGVVKLTLFIIFLEIFISLAKSETQLVYSLGLIIYKNDTVVLKYLDVIDSIPGDFPSSVTGYYIVVSSLQKELFRDKLGVFFTILTEPLGVLSTNVTSINVRVPYFPEAKFITIYKGEEKIFEIDLSKEVCNLNHVCEKGENVVNCPEDCVSTTTIIFQPKKQQFHLYIAILIIIIAILILLIYKIKVVK